MACLLWIADRRLKARTAGGRRRPVYP